MNYKEIKKYDITNSCTGIVTSIFFCGCNFHCPDCFNKEIWDFNCGKKFDDEAKLLLFSYLDDEHVKGLSMLGGEPLMQGEKLYELLKEVKEKYSNKIIYLWTGYYLNEIKDETQKNILSMCDYVIDGRFEKDKKDLHLLLRGSSNQTVWKRENNGNFVKSEFNITL